MAEIKNLKFAKKTYKNFCLPARKGANLAGALLPNQPKLRHHKQLYTFVCLFD
jgi:hypothetical protein